MKLELITIAHTAVTFAQKLDKKWMIMVFGCVWNAIGDAVQSVFNEF